MRQDCEAAQKRLLRRTVSAILATNDSGIRCVLENLREKGKNQTRARGRLELCYLWELQLNDKSKTRAAIAMCWKMRRTLVYSSAITPPRPGKKGSSVHSNLAILLICGIDRLEEFLTHLIQFISFQNSYLGQGPVTGPHSFLAQPRLKRHAIFTQRQAEHGFYEVECRRI
jgi:hypothetical protein